MSKRVDELFVMKELGLPEVEKALKEISFFERDRTERSYVQVGLVLYNAGLSLRKMKKLLRNSLSWTRRW